MEEYRAISAVRVRISELLGGGSYENYFTLIGEQRDGCVISAVFEPKRRFR